MSENFVFSSFQKPNRVTKNAALCVEERHALTVSRQTGGDLVFLVVVRINYGISLLCEIMTDILWVALSLMTLISRVRCSELGVFDGPRLGWLIGETKGYAKQTFVVPKSSESSVNWCGGLIKQLCKHRRFHSAAYQCSKPVVHGGYAFDHERQDHSWSSDSWLNRSPCEWSVVISLQINMTGYTARPQTGVRPSCLPMTARDGLAYKCPSQSAIIRPEDGMTALCIKHWLLLTYPVEWVPACVYTSVVPSVYPVDIAGPHAMSCSEGRPGKTTQAQGHGTNTAQHLYTLTICDASVE